jgi:hypothetical protein
MSDPKPTRIGVTLGSTSRNGGEFEFRKISLSLDRDLGALESPLDAFRDVKALLERMVSEFQGPKLGTSNRAPTHDSAKVALTSDFKAKESLTASNNHAAFTAVNKSKTLTLSENQPVSPGPAASKLATLQERLGARLPDVEVVEGFDGLSIRPKRYLGDAWAEINQVIRALGGHWQKGQTSKDGSWRIPK